MPTLQKHFRRLARATQRLYVCNVLCLQVEPLAFEALCTEVIMQTSFSLTVVFEMSEMFD